MGLIQCRETMKLKAEVQAVLDAIQKASEQFALVGDVRVGREPGKVEVVAVSGTRTIQDALDFFATKEVSAVDNEVARLVKDGKLTKVGDGKLLFYGTHVALVVHNAKASNFVSKVVSKTGPDNFIIECATMAKGLGYKWVDGGLLKVDRTAEGPSFFTPKTEEEFFEFLNMPWTDPSQRKYGSLYAKDAPERKGQIAEEELRQWIKGCRWIDTKAGGESHQFTVRAAQKSDEMFRFVVSNIYKYGYDGIYKGRMWRYLDCDGRLYFTNNYRINETQLINRKLLLPGQTQRAWSKVPTHVRLLSMRD